MYSQASNFVEGVDTSFVVILGISAVFLVGITALMIFFVFKYNKNKAPIAGDVQDNTKLEITWTVIPTILVLAMFYYGWVGFKPMREFPKDSIHINAEGKKWSWKFDYDNGKSESKLYVPINTNVTLHLSAPLNDVNHSLYIPAFRIKEDVVPGIKNKMWFRAQKEGEYDILCAEYCGTLHSAMITKVVVLSQQDYEKWYNQEKVVDTSEPAGYTLIKAKGCIGCHSTDGSKIVGPSFKGMFGISRTVETESGEKEVIADEEYLKKAIYQPNDEIVKGFTKGMMQPYTETVSEDELKTIIEYFKEIK